jgi:cobalt-precorrin-5B (C1)-methyltransferase
MLEDPLEKYCYPQEWIEATGVPEKDLKSMVDSGKYIILPSGNFLRRGLTTGTVASAAVKGALISATKAVRAVRVSTPSGIDVEVPIEAENGVAEVIKDAGDHAYDVTNGVVIRGTVINREGLEFGDGIGTFTRDYLKYRKGEKAVSQSAMKAIKNAYAEGLKSSGLDFKPGVLIEVPDGKKLAKQTGNSRLGIKGGISILGTTGFVEPWCDPLVDMKRQLVQSYERVVVTTGRKGWQYGRKEFPEYTCVVIGGYINEILPYIKNRFVVVGLPSLLLKWAIKERKDEIIGNSAEKIAKNGIKRIVEKIKNTSGGILESVILVDESGKEIVRYEL